MRVVFVRHGQRSPGDMDPPLTSAGVRMVRETAEWLASHQIHPDLCLLTPTRRTRQTAEGLLERLPHVRRRPVDALPEADHAWQRLVDSWGPRVGDHGVLLLVGHHPSLHYLLSRFGPAPVPVPLSNVAAALVLDPLFTGQWAISAAWPGESG